MNEKDRRTLEAMDTRELADIGISRSDLPRIDAASNFAGRMPAAANRDEVAEHAKRHRGGRQAARRNALLKAGSAVSAALITWAIVNAVAQGADPTEAFVEDASWPGGTSGVVACTEQRVGQLAHESSRSNRSPARASTS